MRNLALLPLLRSQAQGSVLAQLYLHPAREYSLTDLARSIGVSVKTVDHEVDRLAGAGPVRSRRVGNVRLLAAETEHRLARPLTDLLAASYGPVPVLTDLLAGVAGVERAFIYGSWAARHAGQAGPIPVDVDVLVVGKVDLDELDGIAREARTQVGFEVNVHRVDAEAWERAVQDPFLDQVRSQPVVELDVARETG